MGGSRIPAVVLLAFACAACRDDGTAPLAKRGAAVVTLEVGGDGPALREVLDRQDAAVGSPDIVRQPLAGEVSDGPARRFRVVRLVHGQTLGQLCAAELGTATRWREVAELNGWSEADVVRLPAGTAVKLPAR